MSQDTLIGRQLANFLIQRHLGQGGMATVYYALDVSLDRPVAVKVIDTRFQGDPEYATRFVEEARMVARWRHQHVIHVYYAGQENDIYFFAMEYIEGMGLDDLVAEYAATGEYMPHPDVLKIGRAIGEALDYAHQQGVIHRDVKPSNVMIGYDDRIVLTDFGLALNVERGTMGQIFGTPHYISPEQARSSADVIPQSDVYSLGVMLYEMLAGDVPFDDPSAATLALQHLSIPPPSPRNLNPSLNKATEDVLLKVLEKEPEKRYQTCKALMDALEKAFDTPDAVETDVALPLPPAAVMKNPAQRRVSRVSVSEKIALHVENLPKPEYIPRADVPSSQPKMAASTSPSPKQTNNRGLMIGGAVVIVILLLIIALAAFGGGNAEPEITSTPVAAVVATDEPTVTMTLVPVEEETTHPTTTATDEVTVIPTTSQPTFTPVVVATNTVIVPVQTTQPTVVAAAITATVTAIPPTATNTVIPPTNTLVPTVTSAPPTATNTVIPTDAPPTVMYPTGRRIQLYWDEYSFYVSNISGASIRVSPLGFDAVDGNGNLMVYAFDGGDWSRFFRSIEHNKCDALEVGRAPAWLRPAQCGSYNGIINPTPEDTRIFWTGEYGATQFRVLWDNQEVARCEIIAGQCLVFLPPE